MYEIEPVEPEPPSVVEFLPEAGSAPLVGWAANLAAKEDADDARDTEILLYAPSWVCRSAAQLTMGVRLFRSVVRRRDVPSGFGCSRWGVPQPALEVLLLGCGGL